MDLPTIIDQKQQIDILTSELMFLCVMVMVRFYGESAVSIWTKVKEITSFNDKLFNYKLSDSEYQLLNNIYEKNHSHLILRIMEHLHKCLGDIVDSLEGGGKKELINKILALKKDLNKHDTSLRKLLIQTIDSAFSQNPEIMEAHNIDRLVELVDDIFDQVLISKCKEYIIVESLLSQLSSNLVILIKLKRGNLARSPQAEQN